MDIQTASQLLGPIFWPHRLELVGATDVEYRYNLYVTATESRWAITLPDGVVIRQVIAMKDEFVFLIGVSSIPATLE
jgi:hypothetical protein